MQRPSKNIRKSIAALLVLPMLFATGCRGDGHACADKCADIPPGAIPRPAGTYACQWQHAQIDRANQENYVIYENEWYQGGRELGPTGQVQVGDLAHHIDETPCKVFIVPHFDVDHNSWNNDLNKQRVEYVVGLLTANGVTDAAQRVEIALPHAEGLYGEEAVRIGAQRLGGSTTNTSGASATGGQFGGVGSPTQAVGGFGGFMSTGGY